MCATWWEINSRHLKYKNKKGYFDTNQDYLRGTQFIQLDILQILINQEVAYH